MGKYFCNAYLSMQLQSKHKKAANLNGTELCRFLFSRRGLEKIGHRNLLSVSHLCSRPFAASSTTGVPEGLRQHRGWGSLVGLGRRQVLPAPHRGVREALSYNNLAIRLFIEKISEKSRSR